MEYFENVKNFEDRNEYIQKIQNPATRLKNANELIEGAKLAFKQFNDLDIKASAICVLIYRFIEIDEVSINVSEILCNGYLLREKLDNVDKFESIRWYLSLGFAMAAFELKENRIDKSVLLLNQNIQKVYASSRHGQPFTNVVKSLAALIGIYKVFGVKDIESEIRLNNFLNMYSSIDIDAFINYKFENQWVYEELSLVFSILYEIAKLSSYCSLNKAEKLSDILEYFDDFKIPEPFRNLLINNNEYIENIDSDRSIYKLQSVKITGVLDGLTDIEASGWVNITGCNVGISDQKPVITVLVGNEVVAEGFANTFRRDIEKLGGLAFGFSLRLNKEVSNLNFRSDFKVIAEFNSVKVTLQVFKPIDLFLQFSSLSADQQINFVDRITSQNEKNFLQLQCSNVLVAKNRPTPPIHKICVIAYANDSGAWFPYFYKYYSNLVGEIGIYIVTPKPESFSNYRFGGVITCENMSYDDDARAQFISGISTGLQAYYHWTLVCDVDEIVVPNPHSNLNFFELLENFGQEDIIVSRGLDVFQMDNEIDFSFELSILEQRRFANPNMALYKPHFSKIPIQYSAGYHYCNYKLSLPPSNDGFVTLHLKSACKKIRKEVSEIVKSTSYALEKTANYSMATISEQTFDIRYNYYLDKNIEGLNSLAMQEFEQKYVANLEFSSKTGLWIGEHITAPFLVDLKLN